MPACCSWREERRGLFSSVGSSPIDTSFTRGGGRRTGGGSPPRFLNFELGEEANKVLLAFHSTCLTYSFWQQHAYQTMSKKSKNPFTAMTAGCIAGAVEATSVWPMEYIKTQLQLQSKTKGANLPYTGMISGLSYTVRTTGFFSLYRGLAPTLIGSVPKAGIRFGLNSVLKNALRDEKGNLSPAKNFVAGLGAGIAEALAIVAPVETVKTKVIELNKPFIEGFKYIIKTDGIAGIYQGVVATALKQGSNMGLRFMWFNEYKEIVTNKGETPMTPLLGLLGGMSAGCFSTLGNNPFDVIKTRMQGTKAKQYSGTVDCLKQILAKEGVGALYVGVVPRLGRVVPGQGIIFMSFETIQSTLEESFPVFR